LFAMIESALLEEGGLSREEIGKKLICFGADGVNVFQGRHNGCIIQMCDFYAPFSLGVHCMAHRMNLVIETLSLYPLVSNIEGLLASLHTYFSGRPKKCVELVKLAGIMETKGLKMLKYIKTRWVSMLSPCKRVLSEYRTLVVKMGLDMNTCSAAKDNFDMLVDLEIMLAFHYLVPMLEMVNKVIKWAQDRNIYVVDFIEGAKHCTSLLYLHFVDPSTRFQVDIFKDYIQLLEGAHPQIRTKWVTVVGQELEHLVFDVGPHHMFACYKDKHSRALKFVTREVLALVEKPVRCAQLLCDWLSPATGW
jgi:hypothetical protein